MKTMRFATFLAVGLMLGVTTSGCRKKPVAVETIPNQPIAHVPDLPTMPPIEGRDSDSDSATEAPMQPLPEADSHEGWANNTDIFKIHTVRFGFDSAALGNEEKSKVAAVADYLKSHPRDAVRVEGHCDERGTEEYNRTLGERRALAVRDELLRLGIETGRVDTISFGEDRPVDPAHNDSAWRQNRRGEFILLTPPS
ncbi:MAG TPA: OmpA family protein [Verrucomicrobiae bacterium]|nr:OmpA family protein [Verrucomicrobiae bacterium]